MDYQFLLSQFSTAEEKRTSSTQRRLHMCLRRAIQKGVLPAGNRLLSSRALAQELGIARNTVIYAYEQLVTEGFLITDQRGSRVAAAKTPVLNINVSSSAERSLARRAQNILSIPMAAELTAGFAPGVPSLAEFPKQIWRNLLNQTWRNLPVARLGYAHAAGEPSLREAIADYLRASRGVECDADQIIVTDGTQSSLDLCAHAFADAGDKIWLENPGYAGAQIAFRAAQLQIIGINVDEDGIAPSAKDWAKHPPKLIYVTPSHQYPTGGVLSLERRMELIQQAQKFKTLIIEDDYDSEFRHDGPPLPAMQGLIPDAPVLYLGTFSKTLFPALRIAYMVIPRNLVQPVCNMIEKLSLRGRSAEQICLARFIREGHYLRHLRRMRRLYRQRRDALLQTLTKEIADAGLPLSVVGATAGMHLTLRILRADVDDAQLSAMLLAQGIVAPALSAQMSGQRHSAWRGLTLGYAQVPVEQIAPLARRMLRIISANL